MRLSILIGFLIGLFNVSLRAQNTSITAGDTSFWTPTNQLAIFFSQSAYSDYWKGGGVNAIATSSHLKLERDFKRGKVDWENQFQVKYGLIKLGEFNFQKNEDMMEIDSKYGYQFSKHLKATGLFSLRSRIHDTYQIMKTGERGKLIGNFMAPGYINFGTGLDYFTKKKVLSIYYTPLNSKITVVTIDELKAQFLPKDARDQDVRYELGSLLKFEYKKEVLTNVFLHTIGHFFTNHLENFGKFDVEIENKVNFKINKHLSANVLTHLVYDEDVLFDIEDEAGIEEDRKGPRTQFREVLNIGFSHSF